MASFHEQELQEVLHTAQAKIEAGEDASEQLDEADELVAQLKIDARSKEAKTQLAAHVARIKDLRDRGQLFKGASANPVEPVGRTRMVAAAAKAEESSRRIEKTQELIDEIEETGNDIMGELQRNRETMDKINGHMKETKGNLDRADKKITRMGKWWSRW